MKSFRYKLEKHFSFDRLLASLSVCLLHLDRVLFSITGYLKGGKYVRGLSEITSPGAEGRRVSQISDRK